VKRFLFALLLGAASAGAEDNVLTLEQGMSLVIQNSPELKSSGMQARSGALEIDKADSRLGWQLRSTVKAEHDISFMGTPVDRGTVSAGLGKPLALGGNVELGLGYVYEDSALALSPLLPNPSHSSRADLSYRLPLAKGWGNVEYHSGMKSAEAQGEQARYEFLARQDGLGRQYIERYYGAAFVSRRLQHGRESLNRSKRLLAHIGRNERIGINDRKDRLQARALVHAREADLKTLELSWTQQRNALNRMMMQPWHKEFVPVVGPGDYTLPLEEALNQIRARDPYVGSIRARAEQAAAWVNNRRDNKRDTLDLTLSVGYRGLSGEDSAGASIDETDKAGSLTIEYRRGLDKRGVDADLMQAQLAHDSAMEQLTGAEADMEYNVASLHTEILRNQESVAAQRARLVAEQEKYREGQFRYRDGRIDISQLIQFEEELSAAELGLIQQETQLAQRLAIMSLWRGVLMPVVQLEPENREKN